MWALMPEGEESDCTGLPQGRALWPALRVCTLRPRWCPSLGNPESTGEPVRAQGASADPALDEDHRHGVKTESGKEMDVIIQAPTSSCMENFRRLADRRGPQALSRQRK